MHVRRLPAYFPNKNLSLNFDSFFMAMKYVLYFSRSIRQADVNIINNKVGRQVYLVNNNNIAARYLAPEYSS